MPQKANHPATPAKRRSPPSGNTHPAPPATSRTSPPAAPPPVMPVRRKVTQASVNKAAKAFQGFSLSKYANKAPPPNHVPAGKSTAQVQRAVISQNVTRMQSAGVTNGALTMAMPPTLLKQLLPSFNAKAGTVDLADVLALVEQKMNGTEFFWKGNPTLNRMAVDAKAQALIDAVKQGGTK